MKRCLIFCFEPFGNDSINSGDKAAKLLPSMIDENEIVVRKLPVSYIKSIQEACSVVEREHPDKILAVGQASGRPTISLERVAVNVMRSSTADNDGNIVDGRNIVLDGPDACLTKMPIDAIASRLRDCGYPVFVSNTAGTFVCNALYYGLLNRFRHIPTLFIHLPLTPAQAAARSASTPSISSQYAADAILTLIRLL